MTKLLIKLFIKNYSDISNPETRGNYINFAAIFGIFCNLVLFAVKLAAGIFTVSVSILADSLNNLSDTATSVVTLIGYRMSRKPADNDHPFGHGRIEYISGFVVSCVIVVVGIQLLIASAKRIFNPVEIKYSLAAVIILALSVLMKLGMSSFCRKIGRLTDSAALKATALDNLSDVLATTAVLICAVISHYTGLRPDGVVGAGVSVFIIISGLRTARDTMSPMVGEHAGEEITARLTELVTAREGISGVHDIELHTYGPGRIYGSLHIQIPAQTKLIDAHHIADSCEKEIKKEFGIDIVIHMDPALDK